MNYFFFLIKYKKINIILILKMNEESPLNNKKHGKSEYERDIEKSMRDGNFKIKNNFKINF